VFIGRTFATHVSAVSKDLLRGKGDTVARRKLLGGVASR